MDIIIVVPEVLLDLTHKIFNDEITHLSFSLCFNICKLQ